MTKVIVEMDLDFEGIEEMSDKERFEAIETILQSGAESTQSYVNVKSIEVFK